MSFSGNIMNTAHRIAIIVQNSIRQILIMLVRGYQFFISPFFPASCRYHPTCSHYAIDAIKTHGAIKGFVLAVWRVLRCNPWSRGGEDPVPGKIPGRCCEHPVRSGHNKHFRHTVPSTSSNDL